MFITKSAHLLYFQIKTLNEQAREFQNLLREQTHNRHIGDETEDKEIKEKLNKKNKQISELLTQLTVSSHIFYYYHF